MRDVITRVAMAMAKKVQSGREAGKLTGFPLAWDAHGLSQYEILAEVALRTAFDDLCISLEKLIGEEISSFVRGKISYVRDETFRQLAGSVSTPPRGRPSG